MPTYHKFLNTNFDALYPNTSAKEFQTHSAILDVTPYKPEVLIIGTFNPDIPNNPADFFYGRNYFWRIFENLSNNNNALNGRRILANGIIRAPNIGRIFELCTQFKLSFADLIQSVNGVVNNYEDNLLDGYVGGGLAVNNVNEIAKYICENKSIKHVYFTRKYANEVQNIWGLWQDVQELVKQCRKDVQFGSIFTPSGQGGVPNFIGLHKAATIARYWIWVNAIPNIHPQPFPNQNGYAHLNHLWLQSCNVNIIIY